MKIDSRVVSTPGIAVFNLMEICRVRYQIGWGAVELNNLDTHVNDGFPWGVYDGMEGCLWEELNHGEQGFSSGR